MKCSAYKIDIAHQPDVHLSIIHAEDHDISHESSVAVQFLNIRVASITPGVKPFVIRLNSTDYGDLREKLQAPIRNAKNVVIHQSLSDKFIEAFKEQVSQNETYQLLEGEEVCFSVKLDLSNENAIKLSKLKVGFYWDIIISIIGNKDKHKQKGRRIHRKPFIDRNSRYQFPSMADIDGRQNG